MLRRLRDVFSSFQEHDVHYVTIGGIAAVLHGVPRATYDLDILIEATPENAQRLLRALNSAGLQTATMTTPDRLLEQEITVFNDYVRIDVQTRTPGLSFEEAWARREAISHRGQTFFVVNRADLIASIRAAGRSTWKTCKPWKQQMIQIPHTADPGVPQIASTRTMGRDLAAATKKA
jgi:hypothetical protein